MRRDSYRDLYLHKRACVCALARARVWTDPNIFGERGAARATLSLPFLPAQRPKTNGRATTQRLW